MRPNETGATLMTKLQAAILSLAVALTLFLAGCDRQPEPPAPAATPTPAPAPAEAPAEPASQAATEPSAEAVAATQEVRKLADDIWADLLENSTYLRMQEGLPVERFEDRTLAQHHDNLARTAEFRAQLNTIDGTQLTGDDLITYEILAFELADTGANDDDYWLNFDITPYAGPYAFQFAQQALAAQQIADAVGADHYLKLVGEMADVIDQLTAQVAGQVERGIYLPKPALPSTRATWEGLKAALPAGIQVADDRLQALTEEERTAFKESLEQLIETRVTAGFDQLLASIGPDYEAKAPETVGLGQYPNGDAVYRRRIRQETTLDLSPEEIHQRGLDAVADITRRMAEIRAQLGFEDGPQEFLEQLKADPRYIAQTPEAVEERYIELIHRIEPKLEAYFKRRPKAAYGVRRLPLASEAGMTYGYYNPPTKADPVGYYNYNASNLPTRSLAWAGSLIYHELLPGHHFHMATQDENTALQEFRRKYSVSAFTEGWAEYAASLGIEMGVYETPPELYGRLVAEMFLASRLVVDTGMNALGWSLEDARQYMRERVIQSPSEIDSETLRYSTSIPAQALAYRLGYEKMWELRHAAEAALGDSFDVRDFHDIVLSDGAKPLPVLTTKVNRWIAESQAR